ncbi:radical SAM protein [Parelusimicrobium proximum]|uniref:TatD family nuclease-associated radical SAM protein n=1 Tax=Parelusimicrobium proximum TaxID=3228953 RepID=UPI003D179660
MDNSEAKTIVYRHGRGLYLNITNSCPNLCSFCIKTKWNMDYEGKDLSLKGFEPSAEEVLSEIRKMAAGQAISEIVFCGYGEPTSRFDTLITISKTLKEEMAEGKFPPCTIRLNTIGLGSKMAGHNVVPELAEYVDDINISLNAPTLEEWRSVVNPKKGYEDGFYDVVEFIKESVGKFRKMVVSMVSDHGVDEDKMRAFVTSLGAELYVRRRLDD